MNDIGTTPLAAELASLKDVSGVDNLAGVLAIYILMLDGWGSRLSQMASEFIVPAGGDPPTRSLNIKITNAEDLVAAQSAVVKDLTTHFVASAKLAADAAEQRGQILADELRACHEALKATADSQKESASSSRLLSEAASRIATKLDCDTPGWPEVRLRLATEDLANLSEIVALVAPRDGDAKALESKLGELSSELLLVIEAKCREVYRELHDEQDTLIQRVVAMERELIRLVKTLSRGSSVPSAQPADARSRRRGSQGQRVRGDL